MLRELPDHDQWTIMDNLLIQVPQHSFLACHPEQREKRKLAFDSDALLDSFPLRRPELQLTRDGDNYALIRASHRTHLTQAEHFFVAMSNGIRSVREIIADTRLATHPEHTLVEFAIELYKRMWQRGHIFFSRIRWPA
jgi:hypothetical protein